MDKNINFLIKFEEVIQYKEHRKMRKLLEMTDDDTYLIGDNNQIYGLGKLINLHNLKQNNVVLIDFLNRFEYNLKTINITNRLEPSIGIREERIRWFFEERLIVGIKHGKLTLVENKLSKEKLMYSIGNVFNKHISEEYREKKFTNIIKIIEAAYKQRHGTTVVISTPELARKEAERLKTQSIKVNKIDFYEDVNIAKTIKKITNIDGALYLDVDGNCHAIGVILDGHAELDKGDASRGARYNSAIRYESGKDINGNCLIVIISEDGMIDLVPDSINIEKKINKLSNEVKSFIDMKNFEAALQIIKEIDKLNPNRAESFYDRASILNKMGEDLDEVINMLNTAIGLKADYWHALYFRGYIYRKKSEYAKAINDYKQVIQINPNNKNVYLRLGNVLVFRGRWEEALETFDKLLNLDNEFSKGYYGKAYAYYSSERYLEAFNEVNKALSIDENYSYALALRGAIFWEFGDYDKAILDNKNALQINGNLKAAYKNLIRFYNRMMSIEENVTEKKSYLNLIQEYKDKLIELNNNPKDS
ncbi:tetratricopeptide repeat protein [Niallia sp. BSM11]|uniref:tetratricopeptide repeat protein n=1 Tax=Niallia sp. BSM11 TaxID=3391576 RepID=UPI00398491FD